MTTVSSGDEKKTLRKVTRRHFENFERFARKICSVKIAIYEEEKEKTDYTICY
jgi:hypothetical protein